MSTFDTNNATDGILGDTDKLKYAKRREYGI